jgi:DNA-binding NarL/FixJ family response regulator
MQINTDPIKSHPNEQEKPAIHAPLANKIRVIVQDYHGLYLGALVEMLRLGGFDVIERAIDELKLTELLSRNSLPDIVIVNYKTSDPKTLDLARVVKEKHPFIKVVINTQYTSKLLLNELKRIGVEGFIIKTHDKEQITNTLLAVYNGNTTS